jgi:hypothetical protein
VEPETTGFFRGAYNAFLLAGLCWVMIGLTVWRLTLL